MPRWESVCACVFTVAFSFGFTLHVAVVCVCGCECILKQTAAETCNLFSLPKKSPPAYTAQRRHADEKEW